MSYFRWMAVEVLLTFWPPGPWARMAWVWISVLGMEILFVIFSIVVFSFGLRLVF